MACDLETFAFCFCSPLRFSLLRLTPDFREIGQASGFSLLHLTPQLLGDGIHLRAPACLGELGFAPRICHFGLAPRLGELRLTAGLRPLALPACFCNLGLTPRLGDLRLALRIGDLSLPFRVRDLRLTPLLGSSGRASGLLR